MKIHAKRLENSQMEFTVEVKGEAWENAQKKAFNKITANIQIPGFRKGHVPAEKLAGLISDADIVREAGPVVFDAAWAHVLETEKPEVIARPAVAIKKADKKEIEVVFTVTVRPEIKLGKYKSLGIKKEEVKATKEDFEREHNALLARGKSQVTKEGAAALGDVVVIDFEGFKGDVPFAGGKATKFELELGSGQFIPGFEEQLVGLKAGDSKDVDLSFPEEYHAKDLAGQPVIFKCYVHEVKGIAQPVMNDEFVASLNLPNIANVKELDAAIEKAILAHKGRMANEKFETELFDAIIKDSKIEVPQEFLVEEIKALRQQFVETLKKQGMTFEQFLKASGQTEAKVNEELAVDATRRIKVSFILEEVAKLEKVSVNDKDVDAEIEAVAKANGRTFEELAKDAPRDQIAFALRNKKVIEILTA